MRTLADVRTKCERAPSPYAYGFHNGLALANHAVNGLPGEPKFLDPDTLVRVDAARARTDEQECEFLFDKVLTAARQVGMGASEDKLTELRRCMEELDKFVGERCAQGLPGSPPSSSV